MIWLDLPPIQLRAHLLREFPMSQTVTFDDLRDRFKRDQRPDAGIRILNPWTNVCLSVLSMCKISEINENVLSIQVIPSDLMCKPHSSSISETINCISSASDMFYEDGCLAT